MQKQIKKSLKFKKKKRKTIKIRLLTDYKKRHSINEWIFSKTKIFLKANVKGVLDFSNYATKADLKNTSVADTLDFAKKTGLAKLKSGMDKLDISF